MNHVTAMTQSLVGRLVGWLVGRLVGWLAGWLVGWQVGWQVGWLAGWLVGWQWMPTVVGIRHVTWISIYSPRSSRRKYKLFYQARLLHTLLTPRTLVRSAQYLTRGSEEHRIHLAT